MLKEKVQKVIDEEIAPALELLGVEDGVVRVQLIGACIDCPMADMTFEGMVEQVLMEKVPEIKKIESVDYV